MAMQCKWLVIALLGGCTVAGPSNEDRPPRADASTSPRADASTSPRADAQAGDAAPLPACTGGDDRVQDPQTGNCYMYFATTQIWASAELACTLLDPPAHLVSITSKAENDLVATIAPSGDDLQDIWVGGSDEDVEGDWTWTSGDPWGFENWRQGEPNNDGPDDMPENCQIIEGENNDNGAPGCLWDDRLCSAELPYICER